MIKLALSFFFLTNLCYSTCIDQICIGDSVLDLSNREAEVLSLDAKNYEASIITKENNRFSKISLDDIAIIEQEKKIKKPLLVVVTDFNFFDYVEQVLKKKKYNFKLVSEQEAQESKDHKILRVDIFQWRGFVFTSCDLNISLESKKVIAWSMKTKKKVFNLWRKNPCKAIVKRKLRRNL